MAHCGSKRLKLVWFRVKWAAQKKIHTKMKSVRRSRVTLPKETREIKCQRSWSGLKVSVFIQTDFNQIRGRQFQFHIYTHLHTISRFSTNHRCNWCGNFTAQYDFQSNELMKDFRFQVNSNTSSVMTNLSLGW